MNTYKRRKQFAICVSSEGHPASLELRKVYQIVPDEKAAKHKMGEDYLYPERFFVAIELPQAAEDAFLHAA
jgi:hypothetical protein